MFKCIAYDENNKRKVVKLDLHSEEEVFHYASKNNLKIVDVKKRRKLFCRKKLKDKDLKVFSKQMCILLKSGCEISKILKILIEESNNKLEGILKQILSDIEKGKTIKEAFKNTKAFSSFYISMVATGEMSGNLDEVMDKLSIYYDKEQKLKSKIISILIYPAILVVSMIISFTAILIFLIPNFEEIYADNTIQTPLITKILIFLSHLIRDDFILIIGIIVLIIGGFIYFKKNSQKFNEILNKLYFKTPLVKTFNQLIITNKFVKALSILISSGVQIVYSIETSAKVMDNDYIYQKICESNELIKKGNSIGSSLKKVEELPSLFLSMVVIGEESGRLDNILGTVSEYYENELDSKLERGTKYFENFLTLFIGIIVGIAVISMMMPMFDAVASI